MDASTSKMAQGWCVLFATFFARPVVAPSIGTTIEDRSATEVPITTSVTQETDNSSSGALFNWQNLLIGLLALLNGLAILQLCVRFCCNNVCIKGLERYGRYRCLYIFKTIGCLIYEKPSITITSCSRLSSSTIIVEVKCPGFSDANKVKIDYYYDGKQIGTRSFSATDTRHKLHYDAIDEWNGFIEAKAEDTYGFVAECQFLIPDVPNLQWWQQELTQTYLKSKRLLTYLNASSETTEDVSFHDLSLKVESGTTHSYKDLFSIKDSNNKTCKNILLIGRSGIGKTAIMNQLAYLWANQLVSFKSAGNSKELNQHVLKEFKLVFLLNFQEIKDDQDIYHAIQTQLSDHVPQEVLDDLPDTIKRLGSECLFLFDGFDISSNQSHSNLLHILNTQDLKNCFMAVTCKPHHVQTVREQWLKTVECVHVNGFADNVRTSYIQSFMNKFFPDENGNNEAQGFDWAGMDSYINNIPLLNILSRIPIYLSLMCIVWGKYRSIPGNITGLYHSAIVTLCLNCKESGFLKDEVDVSTILKELGRFALEGLLKGKSSFDDDQLDVDSDILRQGRLLGIIFVDESDANLQAKQRDVCLQKEQHRCVYFAHRSWQEFCASFYLDSLNMLKKKKQFKAYLDQINRYNTDDLELLLRFTCGLSFASAQMIISHVVLLSIESIREHSSHIDTIDFVGSQKAFDTVDSVNDVTFGLGSDNDPWRLPNLLLSDMEVHEPLTEKQIEAISPSLKALFEMVNINLVSHDKEYLVILNKDNLTWPRFVKKVRVFWKQGNETIAHTTSLAIKLMKSMIKVTSMELLSHPGYLKSYCTDLVKVMSETVTTLEHLSCHVAFDYTTMARFLDQQKLKSLKLGSRQGKPFDCTYLFKKIIRLHSLQVLESSLPCDLRTLGSFINSQDHIKRLALHPEDVLDSTKFFKVLSKESKMAKAIEDIQLSNLNCETPESFAISAAQMGHHLHVLKLKNCTSKQSTSKNQRTSLSQSKQSSRSSLKTSKSAGIFCDTIKEFTSENCSNDIVEAVIPVIGVMILTELRIEQIPNMNESCLEKLFTRMKEAGRQKKTLPLKVLSFSRTRIGKATTALAKVFPFTKHLDTINLTDTGLPYRDIHEVFGNMLQVPALEKLYLRGTNLGSGLRTSSILSSRTNATKELRLRKVDLSSCELSDQNCDTLAAVFVNSPLLHELDISDNPSLGESLHKVFHDGIQLPHLEKLIMDNVGLSQGAEPSCRWLNRQPFPLLSVVSLLGNDIGAEEIQVIWKSFQNELDILMGKSHVIVQIGDNAELDTLE